MAAKKKSMRRPSAAVQHSPNNVEEENVRTDSVSEETEEEEMTVNLEAMERMVADSDSRHDNDSDDDDDDVEDEEDDDVEDEDDDDVEDEEDDDDIEDDDENVREFVDAINSEGDGLNEENEAAGEQYDHNVLQNETDEDDEEDDDDEAVDDLEEEELPQDLKTDSASTSKPVSNPTLLQDTEPGFEEICTLDLRNLVAFNSHPVNPMILYKHPENPNSNNGSNANEDYLLQKANEACTQLLAGLWKLETEKTDAGPLAVLPKGFIFKTPRALPPPAPEKLTKWETFAKERGIGQEQKEKRSRKVFDEVSGEWKYRTGYEKAKNDPLQWPIMEVKRNDDPYADPWEKARDAKRKRIDKNVESRMRNEEKAGGLDKGTTTRVLKAKMAAREAGRLSNNVPAGIPVDLTNSANKTKALQRGKNLTRAALLTTQRSTASLGKFDPMMDGEPERKKSLTEKRKKKQQMLVSGSDGNGRVGNEATKSLKVLENVMNGTGAKTKERAIRKGEYAKGETAYDYDFDDGLGAGSFKKKKGRAGAGKMKKITKKRTK